MYHVKLHGTGQLRDENRPKTLQQLYVVSRRITQVPQQADCVEGAGRPGETQQELSTMP